MSDQLEKQKKKILFEGLITKLKKIKHLDIILTVLFIAIILLIYFSTFSSTSNSKANSQSSTNQTQSTTINSQTSTLANYGAQLENKLERLISQIKDAGNVKVIVTFDGDIEKVIAYTTKIEQLEDGGYLLEIECTDSHSNLMYLTVKFEIAEIERK